MELTSVMRDEVFRPAVTLVSPGAIAVSPYIAIVYFTYPESPELTTSHAGLVTAVFIFIFIIVGLLVDNIGARLEVYFDRKLKKKKGYEDHEENWKLFWRVAYTHEPVGHRYLRTIVLKLKFELNTFCSIPFFIIGVIWIFFLCLVGKFVALILVTIASILMLFLFHEAKLTVKLLSDIRRELLKGIVETKYLSSSPN